MTSIPEQNIPVLKTGAQVVFPSSILTIRVSEGPNSNALRRAIAADGWVVTLASKGSDATPTRDALARVGVIAQVKRVGTLKDGDLEVVLRAEERFIVAQFKEDQDTLLASGAQSPDKHDADESTLRSLAEGLHAAALEILDLLEVDSTRLKAELNKIDDPRTLSHLIAQHMSLTQKEAQKVLEMTSLKNRLLHLLELLVERREALKVQTKIRETLSQSLGKQQREAVLREQLKAIQTELGENDTTGPSTSDYRKRISESGMPDDVQQIGLREVARLERLGEQAMESSVIRNYLDLLCEMPWKKVSSTPIDLQHAKDVLERDHYGLKKIKRRILEHLAVMKLRPEKRGSLLLFVGPPGVGKTSLGKSIAEALGREFVRVSLGGVRDDAEIRGHRRTYVGALPGRVIDGIRRAKTKDPVFVLDEIDKLAHGWGGDPASALLEVLDPEQNAKFHDHYLDVPFDLSQVLFIATANSKETIPGPLLDRMESITLSGYTEEEKLHIAKDHLLALEREAHGVSEAQFIFGDEALSALISGYTREAGVRSLRREIAKVIRVAAVKIAKNEETSVEVSPFDLVDILGPAPFEHEELLTALSPGVATGMAWTPVGGDVLFIEAATIPGNGKVTVTGQLGDVMKESSQIAVALARARLEGIAKAVLFTDRDIHVHVPSGAIPKDGPSAGVPMFAAVASMMLGAAINPKIAMTGEITLRGRVLAVGGIKEKVLAAARFGVEEIILPKRNERDLDELPPEVRDQLRFHLVKELNEVLSLLFGGQAKGGLFGTHEGPIVQEKLAADGPRMH